MPSSSSKQHNFMEAIAHSPSFAKKAGVPQSVGKDYVSADKGKTFSKGGEMKESKGMVGKEVAFFKKKGAPKSMIKHEESEMKGYARGGKVRRMAAGGTGDPFELSDTDRENYAKNGAENLKRLKGFFGFGDKEEKPTAAESEKPSGYRPRPPFNAGSDDKASSSVMPPPPANGGRKPLPPVSNPESDNSSGKAKGPQFQNSVMDRGEGEYSGDGLSPAQGYKPSSMPSASRRPKEVSVEKEKTKVTASPGYKRSGATAEELERYAGPFRVTESANKMRKEIEDKIRDSKPGSMTKQMRDAPSISDLYRGQKSMGAEVDDALKSFRASIRGGLKTAEERRKMREAESNMAKGGQVKKMAFGGDTGQPMRGGPRPAPAAPMNPNSIAYLQSQYGMRPQGGPPMKAGGSVKKMAEGGFTREADGIAKKGKTQGKVVKMASGGFVKNADGCAQRGKTKAFQVKMKNGGMC